MSREPEAQTIQTTLMTLAKPRVSARDLLKAAKLAHPEAPKSEFISAAFASIVAVADSDPDKALLLESFALMALHDWESRATGTGGEAPADQL
jgi:hypothetical protein